VAECLNTSNGLGDCGLQAASASLGINLIETLYDRARRPSTIQPAARFGLTRANEGPVTAESHRCTPMADDAILWNAVTRKRRNEQSDSPRSPRLSISQRGHHPSQRPRRSRLAIDRVDGHERFVRCVQIPPEADCDARRYLRDCGVDLLSLYRDLPHIGAHLKLRNASERLRFLRMA
jgi:hypothetical protein